MQVIELRSSPHLVFTADDLEEVADKLRRLIRDGDDGSNAFRLPSPDSSSGYGFVGIVWVDGKPHMALRWQ